MKVCRARILPFIAACSMASLAMAVPVNDLCANATPVTGSAVAPVLIDFDTAGATHDGADPACTPDYSEYGTLSSVDVWFDYHASVTGIVQMTMQNCPSFNEQTGSNGLELGLTISASSNCSGGTPIACSYAFSCDEASMAFNIVANQTYRIRVATFGLSGYYDQQYGAAKLRFAELPAPANSNCATAMPVGPGSQTFNNQSAPSNGPFPNCGLGNSSNQHATWFAYTAQSTKVALVDVIQSDSIAVFNSCSDTTPITCASGDGNGRQWWLSFAVIQGHTYYIRVGTPSSLTNNITLSIQEVDPVANDTCAAAQILVTNTSTSWRSDGGYRAGPLSPQLACAPFTVYGAASIWFVYTPTRAGIATFVTGDARTDTILEAYSGSCSGPVLGCNNNVGLSRGGASSYLAVRATLNVPIYVRLAQNAYIGSTLYAQTGTITANVVDPVSNDERAAAQTIGLGTVSYDNRNATDSAGVPAGQCEDTGISHKDLWYSWTSTQARTVIINTCTDPVAITDNYLTLVNVYRADTGQEVNCNARNAYYPDLYAYPELFANVCGDDRSLVELDVQPNVTYIIRVSGLSESSGPGKLHVVNLPLLGEAVDLLSSATVMTGSGTLDTIDGALADATDVDIYKIRICDFNSFYATTVTAGTDSFLNTSLYLFNSVGKGVTFNDDLSTTQQSFITNANVHANGDYYLVVTSGMRGRQPVANGLRIWSPLPTTIERAPDGPGAAGVLSGWTGIGNYGNVGPDAAYSIDIGGACFIPSCVADHNHSGTVTVTDIFSFLSAWFAGNLSADANVSGTVTVQDIFFFLSRWFAGC